MAPRTDISLDITKVIRAAFDVMNREGIEKLTMRRLAAELSVQPPALYWHFKDKAELLSMMGEAIYSSAVQNVAPAGNWREWLINFGVSLHKILMSCRDAARVFAVARPKPESMLEVQPRALVGPLIEYGLDEPVAYNCVSSVVCLAVGWSTFNDNPALHGMLGAVMDMENSFQRGLEALVAGYPEAQASKAA
jgi:TetR/AcrR family tetracycline transcriptional repressor